MEAKDLEIQLETLKHADQDKNNPADCKKNEKISKEKMAKKAEKAKKKEERAKMKAEKKAERAKKKEEKEKRKGQWLERQRSALMVVASLLATMAFQSASSPPNNLWTTKANQLAGAPAPNRQPQTLDSVRGACNYLKQGEQFFAINTTSFIASLSIILLLMSGLPLDSRFVMWILIVVTWVAISAIALSYTVNVILQTPASNDEAVYNLVAITIYSWIGLVSFLLVGHTVRISFRVIRHVVRFSFHVLRCVFGLFVEMVRVLIVRPLRDARVEEAASKTRCCRC